MATYAWRQQTRDELNRVLPDAIVVLPVGATEQHGPHLATAVDALMAETVARRAADLAAERGCPRDLVLAPSVSFGASDHHLPFGGTLSLRAETLLAVLLDLARSIHAVGGRRLVVVNGHGGNRGICSAAVAAASTRNPGLQAAYLDYWSLSDEGGPHVPGHAGVFETSLALAVEPDLVRAAEERPAPPVMPTVERVEIAAQDHWHRIDGYTDEPGKATAEEGRRRLDQLVDALASRLTELARLES